MKPDALLPGCARDAVPNPDTDVSGSKGVNRIGMEGPLA